MVSAGDLFCERFIHFKKGRQILTLLTFGFPNNYMAAVRVIFLPMRIC